MHLLTVFLRFTADIDYYEDKEKLMRMMEEFSQSEHVRKDSLNSWHSEFMKWLEGEQAANVAYYYYGIEVAEGRE